MQRVTFLGGRVLTNAPWVNFLFYGNWSEPEVNATREALRDFVGGLAGSPWLRIMSTYANNAGVPATSTVNLGFTMFLNSSDYSTSPSESDLVNVVMRATANWPSSGDIYVVLASADVQLPNPLICASTCGGRSTVDSPNGGSNKLLLVYLNSLDRCPEQCASNRDWSPRTGTTVDSLVDAFAQQLVDTITNPDLDGWVTDDGRGVASLCSQSYGPDLYRVSPSAFANVRVGGFDFLLSQAFVRDLHADNLAPGYFKGHCSMSAPSSPAVLHLVLQTATGTVAAITGTFTLTFFGATTAPLLPLSTAADLHAAIEALSPMTGKEIDVTVTRSMNATAVVFELTVFRPWDLPLPVVDSTMLLAEDQGLLVSVWMVKRSYRDLFTCRGVVDVVVDCALRGPEGGVYGWTPYQPGGSQASLPSSCCDVGRWLVPRCGNNISLAFTHWSVASNGFERNRSAIMEAAARTCAPAWNAHTIEQDSSEARAACVNAVEAVRTCINGVDSSAPLNAVVQQCCHLSSAVQLTCGLGHHDVLESIRPAELPLKMAIVVPMWSNITNNLGNLQATVQALPSSQSAYFSSQTVSLTSPDDLRAGIENYLLSMDSVPGTAPDSALFTVVVSESMENNTLTITIKFPDDQSQRPPIGSVQLMILDSATGASFHFPAAMVPMQDLIDSSTLRLMAVLFSESASDAMFGGGSASTQVCPRFPKDVCSAAINRTLSCMQSFNVDVLEIGETNQTAVCSDIADAVAGMCHGYPWRELLAEQGFSTGNPDASVASLLIASASRLIETSQRQSSPGDMECKPVVPYLKTSGDGRFFSPLCAPPPPGFQCIDASTEVVTVNAIKYYELRQVDHQPSRFAAVRSDSCTGPASK